MHQLKLKDNWLLASETDVLGESPQDPEYAPKGWMEVDVPTTVQAALVESGRVPPPWKDRDAELFEPFEDQTWWYRTQFEIDADATESKRFELVFDGISLLATIWLNGTLVGFTHNAHYAHRFDVTRHINTSGTNVLAV
ncbi:MAG: beta galactosidase jelly roll domain-containing protein, partial [Candidatus Latescibacteria bacterium]|nr:beta galactosidase jelly roll domain-containing protein [Candidatus Latescibacterota bacterium]